MTHRSNHADELIDVAALKAQSGEASFAKGVQLLSQGRVQQLSQDGKTISARVQGGHLYRVRLAIGRELVSHCNCPAADYQTICKHGVATALAFNRQLIGLGGVEGALLQVPDERTRLRAYFDRQEQPALLEVLLDELGRNPKRWQHWLRKVDLSEQALSPAKLKTLINKALPRQDMWEWREVSDYFAEATEQFEAIWEGVDALPLEQQWQLTHHALKRLNTVLLQIDDSNGDRFELEADICERLPALFALLPWSEHDKVNWLFTHLVEQPMDVFPEEEAFGDLPQSPAFLALCEQGLERALTQGEQDQDQEQEGNWELLRYAHPLLEAARACGDWRHELKLLASMAGCTWDWLKLCMLCCEHQEPLEGEYWLTKARKGAVSPHEQDACDEAEIALCVALGEKGRAWRLARARFERFPNIEGFMHLRQLQQQLAWQDETLLPWVEQRLKALAAVRQPFNSSSHQDALVRFYLALDRVQDACDWVALHRISPELLLTLADRIAPAEPVLAMSYRFRVAACYVATGQHHGYEQAVAVLRKLEQSLRDDKARQEHFDQQLRALATEHKRKRNFIQLVNQHFSCRL
ncbi:SWIM zinc finger domain-containing protein [Aeromonas bivalvium]|uniref:SWIM zinc finger family protein n=1 Tax=Aeromonas bivalvium TaxID=440079 RepID=UPI0038CFFCA0